MNLPITTWQGAVQWFLTAILLGFGWTIGCALAGRLVTKVGK